MKCIRPILSACACLILCGILGGCAAPDSPAAPPAGGIPSSESCPATSNGTASEDTHPMETVSTVTVPAETVPEETIPEEWLTLPPSALIPKGATVTDTVYEPITVGYHEREGDSREYKTKDFLLRLHVLRLEPLDWRPETYGFHLDLIDPESREILDEQNGIGICTFFIRRNFDDKVTLSYTEMTPTRFDGQPKVQVSLHELSVTIDPEDLEWELQLSTPHQLSIDCLRLSAVRDYDRFRSRIIAHTKFDFGDQVRVLVNTDESLAALLPNGSPQETVPAYWTELTLEEIRELCFPNESFD